MAAGIKCLILVCRSTKCRFTVRWPKIFKTGSIETFSVNKMSMKNCKLVV